MTDTIERKLLFDNGKYTLGAVTETQSHSKDRYKINELLLLDWELYSCFSYWGA